MATSHPSGTAPSAPLSSRVGGQRIPPAALLALVALLPSCREEEAPPPPPPPPVKVAEVLVKDVPVYTEALGETRGNSEIEIRARVEGFIETVDYTEGSLVEAGQLLYTIDSRPFQAQLAATRASHAEAQAQHARARQDVARYEPLVAQNAISREEYETAVAVEKAASAAVDAAQAVVEQAEIDLSYTRVLAPVPGLAGKTEVYPGTLVGRGQSTLLTRISKIDPIHVRVAIAERDYLDFARRKGTGTPNAAQVAADPIPFEMDLADGTTHPAIGRLVFLDRNIDPRTATITVEVSFANPNNIVRPGQYAWVRAKTDVIQGAILVPQRAVREIQGIHQVFVVGEGDVVESRPVIPFERQGTHWVISSGLAAGDKIVVEGIQKAQPGKKVAPEMVTIEPEEPAAGEGGKP